MSKPNLAVILAEIAEMKTFHTKVDQNLSGQLEILVDVREKLKSIDHKLDILIARSERRNQQRN